MQASVKYIDPNACGGLWESLAESHEGMIYVTYFDDEEKVVITFRLPQDGGVRYFKVEMSSRTAVSLYWVLARMRNEHPQFIQVVNDHQAMGMIP